MSAGGAAPLLVFYGNQMSKLNNWIPPKPLQRSCPRASDIHAKLKTNCLWWLVQKLPQGLEQLPISSSAKYQGFWSAASCVGALLTLRGMGGGVKGRGGGKTRRGNMSKMTEFRIRVDQDQVTRRAVIVLVKMSPKPPYGEKSPKMKKKKLLLLAACFPVVFFLLFFLE